MVIVVEFLRKSVFVDFQMFVVSDLGKHAVLISSSHLKKEKSNWVSVKCKKSTKQKLLISF